MSKIGNWVVEMQEDAEWMSKSVFVNKHGVTQTHMWEEVQQQMDSFEQDYFMEMDDGA